MVTKISKHKVFISFHERDIKYKEDFVRMMGKRIVDRSVDTGNIDDTGLKTATVRQKIRDEYIRDAAVAIVLIGPRTWQRQAPGCSHIAPRAGGEVHQRPCRDR